MGYHFQEYFCASVGPHCQKIRKFMKIFHRSCTDHNFFHGFTWRWKWGLRVVISNFFRQCSFGRAAGGVRPGVRPAKRPAGRPDGRSSAVHDVSSAAPKKKHLIEAAPFGRLDQMLKTTVQGRGLRQSRKKSKTFRFLKIDLRRCESFLQQMFERNFFKAK